ncbi:MAG: crosslink repair DNA glycosylase YcaQ family protein [Anaerolineaceae bacterium]
MSELPTVSLRQARNLMLTTLGLAKPPRHQATKEDMLKTIRQITVLQLDTISVVARAHLHILWSRLGSYDPTWIEVLHREGSLFEYSAHAMCFIPIEDYPIYRAHMLNRNPDRWYQRWEDEYQEAISRMRQHLKSNGAVKSSDFERPGKGGAWWDWKAEKVALEVLFHRGEAMVAERRGFQRVYDLRERVYPDWDDLHALSKQNANKAQLLKAAIALGVARTDWLCNYYYLKKTRVQGALSELVREGYLLPVLVEGLGEKPLYVHQNNLELLEQAIQGKLHATHTTILSPFDPLVTDRSRAKELFGFDYSIECYTPAPKRVYGYFTLPILHRGKLVGRMDAKAWRKQKQLEVIHLHLEPQVKANELLAKDIVKSLKGYAYWQGLETIQITQATPSEFREIMLQVL